MKLTDKGLNYIQTELKKDISAVYQGLQECLTKLSDKFSVLEKYTDFSDFGLIMDPRREMVSTYACKATPGKLTELNWIRQQPNYYFPDSAEDYNYIAQFRVLFFFRSNQELDQSVAKPLDTLLDALTSYSEPSLEILNTCTVTVDSQILLRKTVSGYFYDSYGHETQILESPPPEAPKPANLCLELDMYYAFNAEAASAGYLEED